MPYTVISGNTVDLTPYNSPTNYYTLPNTGYVTSYCTVASNLSKCTLFVQLSNGTWARLCRALSVTGVDSNLTPIFLAKGSKVYVEQTNGKCIYFPTN